MIISKTVEVVVNNNKVQYYRNNGFPNCKRYDKIKIPIELLGKTSKIEIEYECDYCHEHYFKTYGELLVGRKIINKDCCNKCKYKKIEEINLIKYGVKTNLMLEENKEKTINTVRKKYGVNNVMQCKEIHDRQKETLMKNYGVIAPILNSNIKKKISDTKIKKYGYEYDSNGMLLINGVYCSKAQKDICDYFHFKINFIIGKYCVDGIKDDLIIEYNGGGHDLLVKEGRITSKKFQIKEKERLKYLGDLGYKVLIIENPNDKPITIEILNNIKISLSQLKEENKLYYQV